MIVDRIRITLRASERPEAGVNIVLPEEGLTVCTLTDDRTKIIDRLRLYRRSEIDDLERGRLRNELGTSVLR